MLNFMKSKNSETYILYALQSKKKVNVLKRKQIEINAKLKVLFVKIIELYVKTIPKK